MAYNYGHRAYQQIPDQYNLKPVGYGDNGSYSEGAYGPASSQTYPYAGGEELQHVTTQDLIIKERIRTLRMVSRVLAVIVSGATLAPLAATLIKFYQTRNQMLTVDGEQRTAWALGGTVTWYTYTYLGVSAMSFIVNAAVVVSYCWGVKRANKTSTVGSVWSGILIAGHIAIWVASIAVYRYGKVPKNGKNNDLWGWTCSKTADEIQSQVTNIDYSRYCTVQTSSFYTGIAQVITSLLSAGIYLLVFLRMRSKKRVLRASVRVSQSAEPFRQ